MYETQKTGYPQKESNEIDPAVKLSLATQSDVKNASSMISNKIGKAFMKHSLQLAVENLFDSGTVEQLMDKTIRRVTTFDSMCSGEYSSEGYDIHSSPMPKEGRSQPTDAENKDSRPRSRCHRSRICHRTSSMGVVVGTIWVRTSTLHVEPGLTISGGKFEITTSFIFYPASWLARIGFHYGVEASLHDSTAGWRFNFSPVRAVPDDSLIFELCGMGEVSAVELLLQRGDASIRDTNSKGWTPLHVSPAQQNRLLLSSIFPILRTTT